MLLLVISSEVVSECCLSHFLRILLRIVDIDIVTIDRQYFRLRSLEYKTNHPVGRDTSRCDRTPRLAIERIDIRVAFHRRIFIQSDSRLVRRNIVAVDSQAIRSSVLYHDRCREFHFVPLTHSVVLHCCLVDYLVILIHVYGVCCICKRIETRLLHHVACASTECLRRIYRANHQAVVVVGWCGDALT